MNFYLFGIYKLKIFILNDINITNNKDIGLLLTSYLE